MKKIIGFKITDLKSLAEQSVAEVFASDSFTSILAAVRALDEIFSSEDSPKVVASISEVKQILKRLSEIPYNIHSRESREEYRSTFTELVSFYKETVTLLLSIKETEKIEAFDGLLLPILRDGSLDFMVFSPQWDKWKSDKLRVFQDPYDHAYEDNSGHEILNLMSTLNINTLFTELG